MVKGYGKGKFKSDAQRKAVMSKVGKSKTKKKVSARTLERQEQFNERIDKVYADLYNYEVPGYLKIVNKNRIKIRAVVWEGDIPQWVEITPKDVARYYEFQAGNIVSGARSLAGFTSDWRVVDNMARESLEIFKILNPEALRKLGWKG